MTSFAEMTEAQRSEHMAKVRGRDTRPELLVRAFLQSAAVEFTAYDEALPGTPDIVVRDRQAVVFVHGCFWPSHGCRIHKPKVNREYWENKFSDNVERDKRAARELRAMGWRVLVIWECETRRGSKWRSRLLRALAPDRRLCHDCVEVTQPGYAHCVHCRPRYAKDAEIAPREPRGENKAARRKRWVRLGLCGICGMPADRRACPQHRAIARKSRRRRRAAGVPYTYHRLLEQGLCRCKAPVKPGHKRCAKCLRRLRREAKKRNARYVAEGRCRFCPTPVPKGEYVYDKHRAKIRATTPIYVKAFVKRRRAAGRCVECGRKSKTYTCRRCKDKANEKARVRNV